MAQVHQLTHSGPAAVLAGMRQQFPHMSAQLQKVALFVERNQERIPLLRIVEIAEHCGVFPSTVFRFVQSLGFGGYTAFRKAFIVNNRAAVAAQAWRADSPQQLASESSERARLAQALHSQLSAAGEGLLGLRQQLSVDALQDAARRIAASEVLWIMGQRAAFAVAAHLSHCFSHSAKPVQFVGTVSGMAWDPLRAIRATDAFICIADASPAVELDNAARAARAAGATVIALADSDLDPLATQAHVLLRMGEGNGLGLWSMDRAMATAQALFLACEHQQPQGLKATVQ